MTLLLPKTWPGRLSHPPSRPGHLSFRGRQVPTHPEPTDVELWLIETENELEAAESALGAAEIVFARSPRPSTAAGLIRALLDVVDLSELVGHQPIARRLSLKALAEEATR